jgi:hypothetical protein
MFVGSRKILAEISTSERRQLYQQLSQEVQRRIEEMQSHKGRG